MPMGQGGKETERWIHGVRHGERGIGKRGKRGMKEGEEKEVLGKVWEKSETIFKKMPPACLEDFC